jgi:ABC-2 type transport system permease protein
MMLLSGAGNPVESMPLPLQYIMQGDPAMHFVTFAKAILLRGAGVDVLWPQSFAVFGIAVLFFALALRCFRRSTAASTA